MLLLMKSCNKPTVNKLHSSSYADIKMCAWCSAGSFKWSKNIIICSTRRIPPFIRSPFRECSLFYVSPLLSFSFSLSYKQFRIPNEAHTKCVLLSAIILLMPTCCNFYSRIRQKQPISISCKRRCSVWFLLCVWELHFIESSIAHKHTHLSPNCRNRMKNSTPSI